VEIAVETCDPSRLPVMPVTADSVTTGSYSTSTHNETEQVDSGLDNSCYSYRLILYVVPSMAVGLLLLACLGFACISVFINCRSK